MTTGARKRKPPRMMAMQASAETVFAFLDIALSRTGLEHAAQSPQRHPSPQTSHPHLADSCWNTFIFHCLHCAPTLSTWSNLRFSGCHLDPFVASSRWKARGVRENIAITAFTSTSVTTNRLVV